MNKKIIFLFCFCFSLFCIAKTQSSLDRGYDYDAAGNRILRKVVTLTIDPPPPADTPPAPLEDELQEAGYEYFVEKLDKVEIKIFPNPTTERVTLEISGWQELKTGRFQLYSLMGQLLQDAPVFSLSTEINLSGLSNGAYILRVFINDETEEWKIIKQ